MKEYSVPRRYQLGISSIPPVEERPEDSADEGTLSDSEESDPDR